VTAGVEILIILALVMLNGFFAGAELAILTAKRNRLEQAAEEGSKGARAALSLLDDTNRFLSAVQIGITGVGTLAAAYGGASLVSGLSEWLSAAPVPLVARYSDGIGLALVTGSIAFASLVIGELVPKRVALAYAEGLAKAVAVPMLALSLVVRPIVAILGIVTATVLRILRVNVADAPTVSVDDIAHLIETGTEQGVLRAAEQEVALEAFQLRIRRARDIMRPRIDIDAVDIDTPAQEIAGVVAMSGFSRLPVYEGDLDHIVGFVYNKDLFQQLYLGRDINIRQLLRQPLFIPENLTLDRLLVTFQQKRSQLAIVLNEFGGTLGMVTFEDVLEELVGEIHDEHRRDEVQSIVQRDSRSWLVDGRFALHDLIDRLPESVKLGEGASAVSTVGGLVITALEELPKIGDVVTSGDITIEVVDMDGARVDRLLVSIP
jgi:putative hemolysin